MSVAISSQDGFQAAMLLHGLSAAKICAMLQASCPNPLEKQTQLLSPVMVNKPCMLS